MPGRAVPMVHMGTPPDGPEPRHARWGTAALAQFGISVLVAGYGWWCGVNARLRGLTRQPGQVHVLSPARDVGCRSDRSWARARGSSNSWDACPSAVSPVGGGAVMGPAIQHQLRQGASALRCTIWLYASLSLSSSRCTMLLRIVS